MELFPQAIEIGSEEGFTKEKDIFGRREFGERLARIVCELKTPSVFLLDAPWGSGKTTFIKMWRGELAKQGVRSIYFDAFANDYQQDAFLAIASQIVEEASGLQTKASEQLKQFKKWRSEPRKRCYEPVLAWP